MIRLTVRAVTEKRLYIIAIASIAALTLLNQIVIHAMLVHIRSDGRAINLAGRQRMLSQRIALLAGRAALDPNLIPELKAANELWNRVHLGLQHGDRDLELNANSSAAIGAMFETLTPYQNSTYSLIAAVQTSRDIAAALPQINANTELFLPLMSTIVAVYEQESREKIHLLRVVEVLLACLSLLILLAEFWFIFRPIVRELKRQKFKLEQLNESKDRVMAAVAHDIRTPLTAIQMAVQMLKLDIPNLTAEQAGMLKIAADACKRSEALIQELLEISLLESEEYQVDRELTRLEQYFANVLAPFKWQADEKQIDLKCTVQPSDLSAEIDRSKFSRVIGNLVTNALKFTPESGRIDVRTYKTDDHIVLEIRDTGIGIPAQLKEVIFDKFSTARRLGTHGETSTGLGMSIVKAIVEKHGGRIWLESQEGAGTVFYVSLPAQPPKRRPSAA